MGGRFSSVLVIVWESGNREIRRSLVRGFVSVVYHVVSSDKKLYSILSLSTQVSKCVPANC